MPHMGPSWFNMVQGTNFKIKERDFLAKKIILVSENEDTEVRIEKLGEDLWQINCLKNKAIIHNIELTELELATAFAWSSNYFRCSEEMKKQFTSDTLVENKFIRDRRFLNFPLPGKNHFSLYLQPAIRNAIKIMLD